MADIKKELNDIKNAVYGREVRSSIHDGIKKINEESEESKRKAEEAHEITQDLLDETFDSAALETNFEQRIDEVIENLQPEWTQFKKDTETQLADTNQFFRYESMINRKEPRPIITWVDDDGHKGVLTKLAPLAEEYGVPFTSAVATGRIGTGNYMTESQIKEAMSRGIEIVSHSHAHDRNNQPVDMSDEELLQDYKTSQKIIKELGGNYRALVQPFGTYTQRELDIAKQVFDYCVGTATRGNIVNIAPFSNYELMRTSAELRSIDIIKQKIDEAIEYNGWLILTSHVDQDYGWTEEKTRQIIEYAQSKGVDFVTLEEGINIQGNIAEFKGNIISASGEVYGNDLGRTKIIRDTSITAETPIYFFDENKITRVRVHHNQGGFPENSSGFLDTYRYTGDVIWSYQVFTTTRDKNIYVRWWDETEEKWTEFLNSTGEVYLGDNAINITDQPTDPHLSGRVACTTITSDASSDFPEGRAGVLFHYGYKTNPYAHQVYRIFRSSREYIRWWTADGWTDFAGNGILVYELINEIDSSKKPFDFARGVHVSRVNLAGGFPGPGVLTTFAAHKSERYVYQELKINGTFDKYVRYANNDNTWSSWRKYVTEEI